MRFDVVVVGGGPAGTFLAWKLAEHGVDVAVIEEDPQIGNPSCCGGLVGIKGMKELGFRKEDWVISTVSRAEFVSPNGSSIEFKAEPQAWVINRPAFDRALAERALAAGATIFLKTRGIEASVKKIPKIRTQGFVSDEIFCDVLVSADGPTSRLARRFVSRREYFFCSQAEISNTWEQDKVTVWLGKSIAPGFFAWAIPGGEITRVGLGCTSGNPLFLLKTHPFCRQTAVKILSSCSGLIPRFFVSSPGAGRTLLVGDAAGQVKPMTGGGLYYGLSCSALAADVIAERLTSPDIEKIGETYSQAVEEKLGREIKVGMMLREFFWRLSDSELDKIIAMLAEPEIKQIILNNFDFDRHSSLASAFFKRAPSLMARFGFSFLWSKIKKILGTQY